MDWKEIIATELFKSTIKFIFDKKHFKLIRDKFSTYFNKDKNRFDLTNDLSDEELSILQLIFSENREKAKEEEYFKPELIKDEHLEKTLVFLVNNRTKLKYYKTRLRTDFYKMSIICLVIDFLFEINKKSYAKKIKNDYQTKYGENGKRFYNLFSGGYIDLILEFKEKDEDINHTIEKQIEDCKILIFVSYKQPTKTIIKNIESKLNQYYATIIHGSSEDVIDKIKEAVETILKKDKSIKKNEIQQNQKIMIYLNKNIDS